MTRSTRRILTGSEHRGAPLCGPHKKESWEDMENIFPGKDLEQKCTVFVQLQAKVNTKTIGQRRKPPLRTVKGRIWVPGSRWGVNNARWLSL